ncbi:lipase 3-like [Belonocnema kinseyi]|uniref:lipase 3-like n=1 Tax=Belonocnema kinseyi TaxID=2817044 RepID=UPI00143D2E73|nr:lipase 3-like [Belonocnema kinseyi]
MENTVFILAIFLYHGVIFTESGRPDSSVTITKFIMNHGYAVEVHNVITEDGYILEIHRIPGIIHEKLNVTKKEKVALLMHGLIGSSATWLVTGPNISMAFNLVDKGYDVWLGNNRGNTYSSKHVSKLETSYGFWDFSWHEMGIYDLPATIDYVLNNTNKKNLHLLCFSQGCTQTFVMGSLKPEYNKKIKIVVALSPGAYMTHLSGLLRFITPFTYMLMSISEEVGYFPVLPASPILTIFTSNFCKLGSIFQPVCIFIIFAVVGFGNEEVYQDKLDLILKFEPAGSSFKQVCHFGFGQYHPGTFRQYYYGSKKNLELYNSTTPPDYPLEKINFPIAIYHGSGDYLATPEDIAALVKKLPNVVEHYLVPGEKLNHYDLVFGRNIRQLVYDRALALMEKYN